jgi:dUTP pyrophosphatase
MSRGFKVVSKYDDNIKMPFRSTELAAGYDIFNNTGEDIVIKSGELSPAISTKLKTYMLIDEFLGIYPRSGHGFKYSVRLANTVGIIDADYYDNEDNEGEIFIKLHNQGEKDLIIPDGQAMCQGIFQKYLITHDDSETCGGKRIGGLGSTN